MKLSILVCTVPSRLEKYLPNIIGKLEKQATKDVEIIYLGDNKRRSVGHKRNDLLSLAQGEYVVFVDDDDDITEDYVSLILRGIKGGADVVNFGVNCSLNGGKYKRVIYDARYIRNTETETEYQRLPNHIMAIKRELALKAGFTDKNMGEDADFAAKLHPLIKTQASIDKVLYFYNFFNKISETQ